ncbi:MAG: hypothetical protein KDC85_17155 [Saprospiraceae bacterium]|nr:hypothetical protein [Saprospiraceae bacterium]MCB9327028.1 hypothetical protein [Lewinellaceae bacterium]
MSSIKENFEEGKKKINDSIDEKTDQFKESVNKGMKKTKRFFRKLFIFLFLGLVVGGGLYMVYSNWTYSTGSRTGYLVKISKKGYVFKTYEGQLNLGGFKTDDETGVIGNIWEFSLKNRDLYEKMGTLEGKKVTLKYKEINKSMPWQGDTNYFITEVIEQ